MAEKVETILRRSVFYTRPRDFYDAYILYSTQQFDKPLFRIALSATHRGTAEQIGDIPASLATIATSKELWNMWDSYRKQYAYAEDITYDMVIDTLTEPLI